MSVSSLCCGCLNSDRKLIGIEEFWKKQYFAQIIDELKMPHQLCEPLHLCYECDALLSKCVTFKHRVKHSYIMLCDYSQKNINTIDPKPPILTASHNIYSISLLESKKEIIGDGEETLEVIKQENLTPKTEPETLIKEEDDISIYSDHHEDDTPLTELKKKKERVKKRKNSKMEDITEKKKKRVKKGEIEMYREVELSLEEVEEERRMLVLKEEYVNAMFRCEKCIVTFPNVDDLDDHIKLKHELHAAHHKCDICTRAFSSEVSYNYHMNKHRRRCQCTVCGLKWGSKRAAAIHYERAHCCGPEIPYGISKIDKNGEQDDSIKQETFPCEFCHKTFRWKTSLRKHLETHKIEMGQKRKPYCEPCRLSFTTTSNLQKHVKTSSKHQIQLKLRKLQEKPTESISETVCIEQVKLSVSRAMQQYPCPVCDKRFQWRGNLARHLHSHAARANGDLVCEPCGRTFSSIATYKQHMKISKRHVSENDFKYMCSDCGKRFANKTKLKDHIDWEHLKNYTHTCNVCQKVFKSHTSLYLHRQVVHKKDGVEHLCDHCGKAFPNQSKLRSHITALHSGATPYRCAACPARFSWHSCLSRHVRRAHPRKKRDE